MPKGYKNLVNGVVVLKEFLKQENDWLSFYSG